MKGSPLYYDSTSAITIIKKLVLHYRTKYIEVKHHFIRENVKEGAIDIHYMPTDE